MNYYEKIIQEKKNYKIFGMDGDQYESRYISEYSRKFADGLKKGLITESQIVTNLIIDYGWSRKNAEKVAEEAKKIARHNSKEENHYAKLAEEKKQKQNGPDEDNKILEKIAPVLVRKYKRSQAPALTPKEVAILLEERNRFPSTLAQQAVQMWYDHV